MRGFPPVQIEEQNYPTVVMGEDNFTGWFSKGAFETEDERTDAYSSALEAAYAMGVRGYSISPQKEMVVVLKRFKEEHPDIVCISNHHWQSGYYLGSESLWAPQNLHRLGPTEYAFLNPEVASSAERLRDADVSRRFSQEQIDSIRLDEDEYNAIVGEFRTFCDFFLVGNIGNTSLITIGREDIVRKECEIVRMHGGIPIGMCQGGGLTLPNYEDIDVAGTWVWINRHFAHPSLEYAQKVIPQIRKPITAYKIFQSPHGFDLEKSVSFLKTIPQIRSIVVGVETSEQARETFFRVHDLWG